MVERYILPNPKLLDGAFIDDIIQEYIAKQYEERIALLECSILFWDGVPDHIPYACLRLGQTLLQSYY